MCDINFINFGQIVKHCKTNKIYVTRKIKNRKSIILSIH